MDDSKNIFDMCLDMGSTMKKKKKKKNAISLHKCPFSWQYMLSVDLFDILMNYIIPNPRVNQQKTVTFTSEYVK